VRIFAGSNSFTLTVSYDKNLESFMRFITDNIIRSTRLEGFAKEADSSLSTAEIDQLAPGSSGDIEHDASASQAGGDSTREEESSFSQYMIRKYGESWELTYLLALLISWAISLAPAILVRFAIVRDQLRKNVAIPLAIGIAILFLSLEIYLGGESKFHGKVLIVALISYYILRKKRKKIRQRII
jgi:hypothetical protein